MGEAGWCEKCEGKWDDTPSGCKEMKKEKKEHCNYSSSGSGSSSSDNSKDRDDRSSDDGTSTTTSELSGKSGKSSKHSSHGDSGVRVALTEAGWCEKCEGKWDDTPSGCKEMKKEKKEHCNYSSSGSG